MKEIVPKILPLAQAGDIAAEDELGDALKAEFWRKKSAENSYWHAAMGLAAAYRDGSCVNQDAGKAIAYYEKVYELHGDHAGEAANQIGIIYNKQGNNAKEFEWMNNGAKEGFDWCMRNLGMCYQCGRGTSQDYRKAREWYQKAIDCHGDAEEDARKCLNNLN